MNEAEILRSYRRSDNKNKQIKILAELNTDSYQNDDVKLTANKIIMILRSGGILKESAYTRRIEKFAKDFEKRKSFLRFSEFVADCLTEIDGADPRQQAAYLEDIEDAKKFLAEA